MTKNINNTSSSNKKKSDALFADYARYYDLLYRDKDYAAEADYVAGLIRKYHPLAQSILELGSGTGIHASLLAEKDFTVHGIERSQEMLARSQRLAKSSPTGDNRISFSYGDIREVRLKKYFDVAISLFHVISYQTTNEDVLAAFDTARLHLNPGGLFIFDVWYGPTVLTDRPTIRIKRMENDKIKVTRLAEPTIHPSENTVQVSYQVYVKDRDSEVLTELREIHVMRYYFKPEIELLAARVGFQCLNAEEWLSGKAIGCDTWGVCFVLRAI